MDLKISEEKKGNLCFMITWISSGNHLITKYCNKESEVLSRYKYLKNLGRKYIAIYRCCEVVE